MKKYITILITIFISFSVLGKTNLKMYQNKYPEADEIILKDSTLVYVNLDGTSKSYYYTKKMIITDKGVRNNSIITFNYDKNYTNLKIIKVNLIKTSGDTIKIDFDRLASEQTNPSLYRMNIYDTQEKSVYIPIEGLDKGDIIEYEVLYDSHKAVMDSTFDDLYLIQGFSPVESSSYTLYLPDEMPLKWKERDTIVKLKFMNKKEKGKHIYRWEVHNVPQIIKEPYMPPLPEIGMRVVMSTISSWKDVSRWYYSLTEPHLKVTKEMKITVDSILSDKKSREDSLKAIFYYVSRNVRYMGLTLETNKPGFEPHDVSLTFNNMYGVCRDKAALLVALLRLGGFDAWPILINVSFRLDEEIPMVYFNHAITAVINPDGSYIIMDPTDEQTRVFLPEYEMGKSFIISRKDGDVLRLTPVYGEKISSLNVERILDSKGVSGKLIYVPKGMDEQVFRYVLMTRKNDDRISYIKNLLKNFNPSMCIDSIGISGLQDNGSELKINVIFHEFVPYDEDTMVLTLYAWNNAFEAWNNMFVGYAFTTITRNYPVVLSSPVGYDFKEKIILNGANVIAYPKGNRFKESGFENFYSVKLSGDTVYVENRSDFKKIEYSLKEYETIRKYKSLSEANRSAPIIIRR